MKKRRYTRFVIQVALALAWIGLIYPGVTIWRDSIPFLVFISLYTIVMEHVNAAITEWVALRA